MAEGEQNEARGERRGAVEVKDLTIGFGETRLLEDLNFEVGEGEIIAVLGESGSGKSTLMRTLIGLLPPLGGRIRILGEEVGPELEQERLDRLRRQFGILFQDGALLSALTVGENVAMPLEEDTALPEEVIEEVVRLKLDMVELAGTEHEHPAELSGGMIKRAALARAIAADPRVLFCDEPTAGLDPATAKTIDELLLKLRELMGITIVTISHDLDSIRNIADRCLMVDKEARGIIARGTPGELQHNDDPRVQAFFAREVKRNDQG